MSDAEAEHLRNLAEVKRLVESGKLSDAMSASYAINRNPELLKLILAQREQESREA